MFESLSGKLQNLFSALSRKGRLTEADVNEAAREIRVALLEADVNYKVAKDFIAKIKEQGGNTGSSEWTANSMEKAPVTIFVFNPHAENTEDFGHTSNVVDVQSTGAAIQTMLLAAQELGIGSLWICDVFYAYKELCEWLGETHEMIAAVSLGYPDESPDARPRKPVDEVTKWF